MQAAQSQVLGVFSENVDGMVESSAGELAVEARLWCTALAGRRDFDGGGREDDGPKSEAAPAAFQGR